MKSIKALIQKAKQCNMLINSDDDNDKFLRFKRKYEQVYHIFNIQQFKKTNFCNRIKGYKNINEQGFVKLSWKKGFEYIPSKLYESEIGAQKSNIEI